MEMGNITGEEEDSKFVPKPKMKEPQVLALLGKWDSFKNYFQNNPADLIQPLNLAGDTPINVAARSDDPGLIRKLLDLLPKGFDPREALTMVNAHGNCLLHQVVLCKNANMVDIVLNYEKEKDPKQPCHMNDDLLLQRNRFGETPVYRAAKYGRLRMLKRMARYVHDMRPHFYRGYYPSILHTAIIGHHFDVALLLSEKEGIKDVAFGWEDENYRLSCL